MLSPPKEIPLCLKTIIAKFEANQWIFKGSPCDVIFYIYPYFLYNDKIMTVVHYANSDCFQVNLSFDKTYIDKIYR